MRLYMDREGMAWTMQTERVCATCGIVIRWQATIVDGRAYCCLGCAQGGPCKCDYDNLPLPDQINPMVLQKMHRSPKEDSAA
jgi:hypothetical protein